MREMLLILQRRLKDVKNFKSYLLSYMGFPGGSVVKNMPSIQETRVLFLDWEDYLEEDMETYSSILA